ncbi:MAG: tetratricopeptide repeat protein [Bacteroidales bacterium]|nr:tetratricopeptide repeat protein [Bacteroidales bacterium]
MDKKGLERNYQLIARHIYNNKLKDALDVLKGLVIHSRKGDYISQYESLDDTYENLLKYTVEGIDDPQREKIYQHTRVSVLELADLALQYAYMNDSDQYIYRLKKKIEFESKQIKDEAINSIENLAFDEELSDVLESSLETETNKKEEYQNHQEVLVKIFNLILLTDKFKDADLKLINTIWEANNFPWYEQSIIISALTLSSFRCFDVRKIELLIDYTLNENDQIKQRALVGLFLNLYIYNKRISFFPDLIEKIKTLADYNDIEKNIELIAIQLLKSKETEKITKKLEEEILPEMVKYQPILKDKLDLDNILSSDYMDDKNPDWERVFEDAPDLLDKLQEISKLQMEGADVFMSAFSRLKHFEFFNEITNWFRPFHTDNFVINEVLDKEEENFNTSLFLDGLSKSFFMCNSDKYSFCLNIQYMPELQKSMMLEMFNAELEGLREIQEEDEILNKSTRIKSIYSQYIQDLYRFYKLHPLRGEFKDIFNLKLDFYYCDFFTTLVKDDDILRNIGEFFFEKDYYEQALEIYLLLNSKGNNNLEIFEKIGYSYQKLKNYKEALSFYRKAELFEANRAWNLKKLALCNRHLKNYEESLKYYLEAEKIEPDNLYIQTYIGHSYLDLKQYEEALKYYFKVEFTADENRKVLRPIAWCSFLLGKFEKAKEYFERLMENEANKYDFMNLGHVEWCLGDRKAALKNYKTSINREDNNLKSFMGSFEEDKKYLIQFGIKESEITFMIDYLKYLL